MKRLFLLYALLLTFSADASEEGHYDDGVHYDMAEDAVVWEIHTHARGRWFLSKSDRAEVPFGSTENLATRRCNPTGPASRRLGHPEMVVIKHLPSEEQWRYDCRDLRLTP